MYSPNISELSKTEKTLEFRLSGVDTPFANALRRTVLTGIERIVIDPDTIVSPINTSPQFKNEIIRQRLQSVPVIPDAQGRQMTDEEMVDFCMTHRLEIQVQNTTNETIYVTTDDIRLFRKDAQEPLSKEATNRIFPTFHGYPIDLLRLYPSKGPTIPGEQIRILAGFSIKTAADNACFTVGNCSYQYTPNAAAIEAEWTRREKAEREKLTKDEMDAAAIQTLLDFKRTDFMILDSQRINVKNSFDFLVKTNGIYDNEDLVYRACQALQRKFEKFAGDVQAEDVAIVESYSRPAGQNSQMPNSYDVILTEDEYTMGVLLDRVLYDSYLAVSGDDRKLAFSGFVKYHPHKTEAVLRLAFVEPVERTVIKTCLIQSCQKIIKTFQRIESVFQRKRVG